MKFNIILPKNNINKHKENTLNYQNTNKSKDISLINRYKFKLLDGPPYANGELHLGHLTNKILKNYCILTQQILGKNPKIKANWDCHGLPVELDVNKYFAKDTKSNSWIAFACRIYSLNWAKVQALQIRMFGITSYKRRTTTYGKSKMLIMSKIYNLIKLGNITFGRKYTTWILSENTSIPDNDVKKVLTKNSYADVTYLVSKRLQIKSCPTQTLIPLIEKILSPHIKLFNCNIKINNAAIWPMPWATHVCVPNKGLKIMTRKGCTNITSINYKTFNQESSIKKIPTQIIKQANLLNIFNLRSIPIVSAKTKDINIIGHTTQNNKNIKLTPLNTNLLRYNKTYFNKSSINSKSNSYTGELYVINKLITCSLISKCYDIIKPNTISNRSKTIAIKYITPQWYIKLNYKTKQKICNYLNKIRFKPELFKKQLTKLLLTRPDWTISRQRTWGIPICAIRNKNNKIIWDEKILKRINNLLINNKEFNWEKINTLYPPYKKYLWKKEEEYILDTWLESSTLYILRSKHLPWNVVLEGADQHRGWFQAIIINSILSKNKLPFKTLITHPFIMNNNNEKMSKSGTGIWISKLFNSNSNVIRIWASNTNLQENKVIENNWLLKPTTNYIKICNLLKWALEIPGITNTKTTLALQSLTMRDRFMLHRLAIWSNRIINLYKTYSFNKIINNINIICNELSTNYLNPSKDILYCNFHYSTLRCNCIFIIKCWIIQISKWLKPIIPTQYNYISKLLKLNNSVLNPMPSNWYNKKIAKHWRIINKIYKTINKLNINSSSHLINIYILVQNISTLKILKNMWIDTNNIKTNVLLVKEIKNAAKINPYIGIKISIEKHNQCSRCKKPI